MRVTIYWVTRDYKMIRRIQKELNLPEHMSVNYETVADVSADLLARLKKGEPKFLLIRRK